MSTMPTIPMIAPDGTSGEIPVDRVQDAMRGGGKRAFEMVAPDGKSTGYIPEDQVGPAQQAGARYANYNQNPKLEGTYNMWDSAGHRIGVPYSMVQSAQGQGFKFDTNADGNGLTPGQRFQKDQSADPNAPKGPGVLDPRGGWSPLDVARGAVTGVKNIVAHPIQTGESMGESVLASGVAPGGMYPTTAATGRPEDSQANAQAQEQAQESQIPAAQFIKQNPAYAIGSTIGPALVTAGAAKLAPALVDAVMPSSPLGDMLTKPRGTVPAEFASPAELKAYADKNDIPFNAAQATQHNLPLNLQSAGERATIGGTAVKQQIRAGQAAVMDHAQSLMDKLSPNTTDVGTAGAKLQTDIAAALDAQKGEVQQGYAAMDKAADGVSVDLKPLKAAASQTLKDSDFIRTNVPGLDPKRASSLLRAITGLPDSASFTDAGAVRSGLLDEARHPDNVLSEQAQGWIKNLTGVADSQMSQAAASSPDLTSLWRDTNAQWKGINEDFGSPRSPLYQALKETDPNKIPQKFTSQGQIGGSPYNAQLLDKYGIDKAPIKWALMGDMIKKDFGLYNGGKTLAGYSDPFLESMFTPAELDGVYKTGAIARSLKANTNYSGTAAVEGAMSDVQRPLRSMLPKAVAAKITNSQRLNNWLMNNPAPVSTPPASALTPIGIMGSLMGINQK